jgi:hypothetical protein
MCYRKRDAEDADDRMDALVMTVDEIIRGRKPQ